MLIAFAFLFVVFAVWKREWLAILWRPRWIALLAGVLIACNYYGFMKGIELTSASNAQVMIQVAPMTFALASMFLFREIPSLFQGVGLSIAVLGFAFFYWDQILVAVNDSERFQTGNLWLMFAAFTWVGFALIQKSLFKVYKPQQFNLLIYFVSALVLLPLNNFSELVDVGLWDFLLILFLSLNTVVAYGALSEALSLIPAPQVSVIISVNPLLTLLIMTYLTQIKVQWISAEPIHWRGALGAILVVIGVILTVAGPRRLSART